MPPAGAAADRAPPIGVVLRGSDLAPSDAPVLGASNLGATIARLTGAITGRAVVCARLSAPTPAASQIIHAVVDALVDCGAAEVAVGTALRGQDRDRGHLSVSALAHIAGLSGRTARGRPYDLVDLAEDTIGAPVPATSVLHGQPMSRLWAATAHRVVIGRAVTDLFQGYAAGLDALAGVCPDIAGAQTADVVSAVLQHVAPTLAIVDATVVSDGGDGARIPHLVPTDAVIVATDALLADCTVAELFGMDRSASPLVQRALADLGEPTGAVEGERAPFAGISRPQPLALEAARRATRATRLHRVLAAAIGGPDEGALPSDSVLAALRSLLTPAVAAAGDPMGQGALVALLSALAATVTTQQAWSIGLHKDSVGCRVVPLGFDPQAQPVAAYDGLPDFFAPFDAVIDALPPRDPGALRWTLVDGATVFEVSRDIAADFDDFVARVDVAEGISLMADYIGGRRVSVDGIATTRQAERNLYLPQPNYLAAWGGEPIDVCKVELVEKGPDQHRLWWRTVSSPNGSATHDDGSLTFARTASGVRVSVRGRQLFTLPPFWAAADLTRVPELHAPLLEDAYRCFFTTTFDNLEACFEGRDFRIGRPAPDPEEALATATVQMLLDAAWDWLRTRASSDLGALDPRSSPGAQLGKVAQVGQLAQTPGVIPDEVDVHGFRHHRGRR